MHKVGFEQPGGLQWGVSCQACSLWKADERDWPDPAALTLLRREQVSCMSALLCLLLLGSGASGRWLCAKLGMGFSRLGSQSFPAWLSSYSLFEQDALRAENMFLYVQCSTPDFNHFNVFCLFVCFCSHVHFFHSCSH